MGPFQPDNRKCTSCSDDHTEVHQRHGYLMINTFKFHPAPDDQRDSHSNQSKHDMQMTYNGFLQQGLFRSPDQVFCQEGFMTISPIRTCYSAESGRDQRGYRHHKECQSFQIHSLFCPGKRRIRGKKVLFFPGPKSGSQ